MEKGKIENFAIGEKSIKKYQKKSHSRKLAQAPEGLGLLFLFLAGVFWFCHKTNDIIMIYAK